MADFIKDISNNIHYGSGYISSISYFNSPSPSSVLYSSNQNTFLVYDQKFDHIFNKSPKFNGSVNTIKIDQENTSSFDFSLIIGIPPSHIEKIYSGGDFTLFSPSSGVFNQVNRIVKFNLNGVKDNIFDVGDGYFAGFPSFNICPTINSIDVQSIEDENLEYPVKRIIAGGRFMAYKSQVLDKPNLIALDISGNIDSNFSDEMPSLSGTVNCIRVDNSNKILVGGDFRINDDEFQKRFMRLNSDGTLDNNFDNNLQNGFGSATSSILNINFSSGSINSIDIQPDEKILLVGNFRCFRRFDLVDRFLEVRNLIRLNESGEYDETFKSWTNTFTSPFTAIGNAGLNGVANTVKVQRFTDTDFRILIGGSFTSYKYKDLNDEPLDIVSNRIIRLFSDGTPDTTFGPTFRGSGFGFNNTVTCITIDSNSRILVGGLFTTYNNKQVPKIVRLLPTGTLDKTFNFKLTKDILIRPNSIEIDSLGHIYIGGQFERTIGNKKLKRGMVKLFENGHEEYLYNPIGYNYCK
jgi:uncharacterized delta-60 repeat protein